MSGRDFGQSLKIPEVKLETGGKTSLDCATIALKVLKSSMRQQVKLREKHGGQSSSGDCSDWEGR